MPKNMIIYIKQPWSNSHIFNFFASAISFHHLKQDPTPTKCLLCWYACLVLVVSCFTGGTMSHKIIPFLVDYIVKHSGSIPRNACVACETWLCVTTKKVWLPDRQTPDKVIPVCRYASQATQKWPYWPQNLKKKKNPTFRNIFARYWWSIVKQLKKARPFA